MFDPDLIEAEQAYLEKTGMMKPARGTIIDPTNEIKKQFERDLRARIIDSVFGLPPSPYPAILLAKSEAEGL